MKRVKLGRKTPKDWLHVEKYPYGKGAFKISNVNKSLSIPYAYDQGNTNGCVGYSSSTMMSIYNRHRYNALWLYHRSQVLDGDPTTTVKADNGTYTDSAFKVLRKEGHKLQGGKAPLLIEGIKSYSWCTTIDEIRSAISSNKPVLLGVNWYSNFSNPEQYQNSWWIGRGSWGVVEGGHAICCFGASDDLQALRLVNTWKGYPRVYISYESILRLLQEDGEAGVAIDR